jgi:hypothetical protein
VVWIDLIVVTNNCRLVVKSVMKLQFPQSSRIVLNDLGTVNVPEEPCDVGFV